MSLFQGLRTTPLLDIFPDSLTKLPTICLYGLGFFANIVLLYSDDRNRGLRPSSEENNRTLGKMKEEAAAGLEPLYNQISYVPLFFYI